MQSEESVEHLCDKCKEYAANWKPEAEALWEKHHFVQKGYCNYKKKSAE